MFKIVTSGGVLMSKRSWLTVIILVVFIIGFLFVVDFNLAVTKQQMDNYNSYAHGGNLDNYERPWTKVGVLIKDVGANSYQLNQILQQSLLKVLEECGFEEVVFLPEQTILQGNLDLVLVVIPKKINVWPTPFYRQGLLDIDIRTFDAKEQYLLKTASDKLQFSWNAQITNQTIGLSSRSWVIKNMVNKSLENFITNLVKAINKNAKYPYLFEPQTKNKAVFLELKWGNNEQNYLQTTELRPDSNWLHPQAQDVKYVKALKGLTNRELILYTLRLPIEEIKDFLSKEMLSSSSEKLNWDPMIGGYHILFHYTSKKQINIKILSHFEPQNYAEPEKELKDKLVEIEILNYPPAFILAHDLNGYHNKIGNHTLEQLYQRGMDLIKEEPNNPVNYYTLGDIALQKLKEQYPKGIPEIDEIRKTINAIYEPAFKTEHIPGYTHYQISIHYFAAALYFQSSEMMQLAEENLTEARKRMDDEIWDIIAQHLPMKIAATYWYPRKNFDMVLKTNRSYSQHDSLKTQIYLNQNQFDLAQQMVQNSSSRYDSDMKILIALNKGEEDQIARNLKYIESVSVNYGMVRFLLLKIMVATHRGGDAHPYYEKLNQYPGWVVREKYQNLKWVLGENIGFELNFD